MQKVSVCVLGSGGVGKFREGVYDPTIVDSYTKQVEQDGKFYTMDIIDTAGQEEFKTTRDLYIQQGNSFIVVYSITDAASYYEAQTLFKEIAQATDKDEFPVVLVGNKSDMEDNREVSTQEAKEFCAGFKNCVFMEASAKGNHNVEKSFQTAVELWIKETSGTVDQDKIPELDTKSKPTVPKQKTGLFSSITGDSADVDEELAAVKK